MADLNRTEFGYNRTVCGCKECQTNCRFIPGYLIPSDLDRLLPVGNELGWAAENLLASPGATAMKAGHVFHIPTLVPSVQPDGTCVNLSNTGLCQIHAAAPFGCAFFDCNQDEPRYDLSAMGLKEVMKSWAALNGLKPELQNDGTLGVMIDVSQSTPYRYAAVWQYLWAIGKRQRSPQESRERMAAATALEGEVTNARRN